MNITGTALLSAAVLATALTPVHAIIRRHDVDPSEYLWRGAMAQFNPVGEVGFRASNGFPGASGVLIDRQWVLTAAHRINQDPQLEWAFQLNGVIHDADQIIYAPNFSGTVDGRGGGDLALVHLISPIRDATPATIARSALAFGSEVTLVGYGGIGDGLGNDWTFTKERWAATNLWDTAPTNAEYFVTDFDNPADGATPLEGTTTNGDAGAGLFAHTNGNWELHGITSNNIDLNNNNLFGDYGDRGRHTRLDAYLPWIDSVVPAPSSLALLGLGGLAVARRRRV